MRAALPSFPLLWFGLLWASASAAPPPPGPATGTPVWLAPAERLALVQLLTPVDPDHYILRRLPLLEAPQPADLLQAMEAKNRQPRQVPATWYQLAVGFALWGQYDRAISTLARHRPEPEEQQSLRVLEAWLLEQNGQADEARSLFRSLAESAEERRPILRQLIALELRQQRFQAALDVLQEAKALQNQAPPPSLEYLEGLCAFAVGDDLNAWKTWIQMARRPPSEQIPQTFLGLSALSVQRQEPDAALGWFALGMEGLAPPQRRAWLDTVVAARLGDHPEYAQRIFPWIPSGADEGRDRMETEFHQAYRRHYEEMSKGEVRIRLRMHEPHTTFRTLNLFDFLDGQAPTP